MSDVEFKIPVFVADISDNGIIELTKSGKVLFANNKAKCIFRSEEQRLNSSHVRVSRMPSSA